MHESSLAHRILDAVLTRAHGARVTAVRGRIAETEALSRAAVEFHFAAHARGTPAEGARLDLAIEHVHARCRACGCVYPPDHHVTLCPQCGGVDADLLGQPGVRIDEVDVAAGIGAA
jgi:hydrogenase nickel incorporation protein HypA/HybF